MLAGDFRFPGLLPAGAQQRPHEGVTVPHVIYPYRRRAPPQSPAERAPGPSYRLGLRYHSHRKEPPRMAWGKLDDKLHAHPKFELLSYGAIGLWTESLSWACAYKTDGFIPAAHVASRHRREDAIALALELEAAGLWEPVVADVDVSLPSGLPPAVPVSVPQCVPLLSPTCPQGQVGDVPGTGGDMSGTSGGQLGDSPRRVLIGWRFHDWHDYQPDAKKEEARKAAAREKKRLQRQKAAEKKALEAAQATAPEDAPVPGSVPISVPGDVPGDTLGTNPPVPVPVPDPQGGQSPDGDCVTSPDGEVTRNDDANHDPATSATSAASPDTVADDGALIAAPAPTPKKKPKTYAHRIPEDWQPSPKLLQWTMENTPSAAVQDEFDNFRDYWTANATANARKRDWDAAWRTWARRVQNRATSGYRNQDQIMRDARQQAMMYDAAVAAGAFGGFIRETDPENDTLPLLEQTNNPQIDRNNFS